MSNQLPLYKRGLFIALLFLILSDTFAPLINGSVSAQSVKLGPYYDILMDPTNKVTIDDILEEDFQGDFEKSNAVYHYFGYTQDTVWLRLDLKELRAKIATETLWYEFVDKIESLTAYYVRQDQSYDKEQIGYQYIDNREIAFRSFILELDDPAVEKVYFQLEAEQLPIMLNTTLFSTKGFIEKIIHYKYFSGIFYGFMLSLALYNLFLYFSLRERAYLFYVLYMISFTILQFAMNSLDVEYFGEVLPASVLVDTTDWMTMVVGIFMILFSRTFLDLSLKVPVLNRILSVLLYSSIAVVITYPLIPDQVSNQVSPSIAILTTSILWISGLKVMLQGYKIARYYVIGWTCLLISIMIQALAFMNVVPNDPHLFELIPQSAAALEALFLSLALADRITIMKKQKEEAQEALNYKLEELVNERTKDLEEAMMKLEDLSNLDQLTQVYNRRKLDYEIERALKVAKTNSHPLSVILLDIDHFKSINDRYGHQMGDEVLARLASHIERSIEPDLTFGRWGGEEFLMILPNRSLQEARTMAEFLRGEVNRLDFKLDFRLTSSFGVTTYEFGEDWSSMMSRADEALYKAKENGRNRIEILLKSTHS